MLLIVVLTDGMRTPRPKNVQFDIPLSERTASSKTERQSRTSGVRRGEREGYSAEEEGVLEGNDDDDLRRDAEVASLSSADRDRKRRRRRLRREGDGDGDDNAHEVSHSSTSTSTVNSDDRTLHPYHRARESAPAPSKHGSHDIPNPEPHRSRRNLSLIHI